MLLTYRNNKKDIDECAFVHTQSCLDNFLPFAWCELSFICKLSTIGNLASFHNITSLIISILEGLVAWSITH